MILKDLIVHTIIDEKNCKQVKASKIKEMTSKANIVKDGKKR